MVETACFVAVWVRGDGGGWGGSVIVMVVYAKIKVCCLLEVGMSVVDFKWWSSMQAILDTNSNYFPSIPLINSMPRSLKNSVNVKLNTFNCLK